MLIKCPHNGDLSSTFTSDLKIMMDSLVHVFTDFDHLLSSPRMLTFTTRLFLIYFSSSTCLLEIPKASSIILIIILILLIPIRSVCDRLLDLLPHPDGRDPRPDGSPGNQLPLFLSPLSFSLGHPLPRPRQHLQHRHHQHTKG